ncbi:MAG: protein-L-isoaspartate O-methyltransferase, partial [Deltaproteobacteria bacterium CG07_land_8_20_14_0_80_38_7]
QYKDKSYADITVPIGRGENLDRPYDDAYILNALNLTSEDKVLEIGTGSGYLTALLSRNAGKVYTIDIIPEFTEEAVKRFKQLGYTNIIAKAGDGFLGWPEFAPFDAIVLTCSPTDIPQPIAEQLAENGRMLIPLGGKDKF